MLITFGWKFRPSWSLAAKILCVFFCCLAHLALGQELLYRTVRFSPEYRQLQVLSTHTSRNGTVWLATQQGLFRYDGAQLSLFAAPDSAFATAPVSALYEDSARRLWVGYKGGGLYVLEEEQLSKPSFAPQLKADIAAFAEDAEGRLWFATYGNGLYVVEAGTLRHYSTAQGLPDDFGYTLLPDRQGRIWIGTDRGIGICQLKEGKLQVQRIGMAQGLPDNIVRVLTADEAGYIWAGTDAGGFCRLAPAKGTVVYTGAHWQGGAISSLLVQKKQLWVGSRQGVFLYEEATGGDYQLAAATLAGKRILSLATDRQANIWIAADRQLLIADPAFHTYPLPEGISNLYALFPAEQGIWLGTEKGLCWYDSRSLRLEQKVVVQEGFPISAIYQDGEGAVWYGTLGGGLYRYEPGSGQLQHYTQKEGLPNDNLLTLAASPSGTVWISTLGGLASFQPSAKPLFTRYSSTYPKTNYVYDVLPSDSDGVWFATDGEGVTQYKGENSRQLSEVAGLQNGVVYAIRPGREQIGFLVAGQGIVLHQKQAWKTLGLDSGLRSLEISGFALSDQGYLLAAHPEGLDVQDLQSTQWRHYDTEWGIEGLDVYTNAVRQDGQGNIWVGTARRLLRFAGKQLGTISPPVCRLTEVELFYEKAPAGQQKFAYDENHFSFHYTGSWYQQPERIRYRLMLEGYDTQWENSRNTFATYSNLPPGKYTFRVQASVTPGFAHAAEAVFPFQIGRPFWQQLWFWGLMAVVAVAGVWGLVRVREGQLRREEKLKREALGFELQTLRSQINPHFLFNSFNTLITEIEEKGSEAAAFAEHLSDFFRNILTYQEKNLIPLQEELQLVDTYLYLQQKRYRGNLQVEKSIAPESLSLLIPPLTLQLLLENAIKHNVVSSNKPLHIRLYTQGTQLVIENSLQKKRMPEASTQVGLRNIIGRYRLLTRQAIAVQETTDLFVVTIPLLAHG